MKDYTLEICAGSVASCIEAERGGASRIELCAALPEGGTTPSLGTVAVALERVEIPVFPIIRPRSGDFLYTQDEVDTMECDIRMFVDLGVRGVVIGALTPNGEIDCEVCRRLIDAAQGISVTLHRAFDMVCDYTKALEDAITLGFDRILTSGGAPNAFAGMQNISRLIEQADGRISIMPGSGIREDNIATIAWNTGAREFHASLRAPIESKMIYRNPHVSMGGSVTIDEYSLLQTDAKTVASVVRALQSVGVEDN